MKAYTNGEIQKIANLTHRQVIYLTEKILGKPEIQDADGRGSTRLYSVTDLLKIILAHSMRSSGIELKTVSDAMALLNQYDLIELIESPALHAELCLTHSRHGYHGLVRIFGVNSTPVEMGNMMPSTVPLTDLVEDATVITRVDINRIIKTLPR